MNPFEMPVGRRKIVGRSDYRIVKRSALDGKEWWVLLEHFNAGIWMAPGIYFLGKYKTLKDAKYAMGKCETENAMLRGAWDW